VGARVRPLTVSAGGGRAASQPNKSPVPAKRFYVALPPRHHPRHRSDVLRRIADAAFVIGDTKIRAAQLPDKIVLPNGVVIERPVYWR
jgi:hypothetical protein